MNRNTYIDGTIQDALDNGYGMGFDIVQLKYDGNWCRMVSSGNYQQYFSDTDRQCLVTSFSLPNCTLIGELMRGTQWAKNSERHGKFFIFDLWERDGQVQNTPYSRRYAKLRIMSPLLPENYIIVRNYRLQERQAVWDTFVEGSGYEGVVYRRSTGPIGDQIIREKKVFTLDGQVTGFVEGEGKHQGRLGALEVKIFSTGATTTVGNGFNDAMRQEIWGDRPSFLGRWLEFQANAVFASGATRHSRFLRWREDKA